MLLTFKLKHGRNIDAKLAKARKVAEFASRPPLGEGDGRLHADRDRCKGRYDTPQEATL
jgi:hypothetical protein